MIKDLIEKLNFDEKGLIPAIIQDFNSSEVLTLCYMDEEALSRTLSEKKIFVYRRSRGRVMIKGETSGCMQDVKEVFVDCAANSLLFKVKQHRAACHEGYFSCFFRQLDNDGSLKVDHERIFDPEVVYKKTEK